MRTVYRRIAAASLVVVAIALLTGSGPAVASGVTKVLMIVEENHSYTQIIGSPQAPYLNALAKTYGLATRLDAGYPAKCPSLAAYIVLTSGTTGGICDDKAPRHHPLTGPNIFRQLADHGRQWRGYAESAPSTCALGNASPYLVRHVPATYYLNARAQCARWAVPMGTTRAGALHNDLKAGHLPDFSFLTPDACHDMHGAPSCSGDFTTNGDRWLKSWLPVVQAAPDYRAGRLAIIITWDEGTSTDNHIPTLIISPRTRHVSDAHAYTHCSTLRTTQELLRLPLLGCAAKAPSMRAGFHL
jgi:phospholipase C